MKLQSRLISAEETFPLRRQMRPLRSVADQGNSEDLLPDSFHVGTFAGDNLVGIASFNLEGHKDFATAKNPFRLRGMASEGSQKGLGIGRQTLLFGIEELRKRDCDLLWCNAREVAFPFYEKMGLSLHGPMFDIPTIGPHKVMYKHL